jgi:hypothetical protein
LKDLTKQTKLELREGTKRRGRRVFYLKGPDSRQQKAKSKYASKFFSFGVASLHRCRERRARINFYASGKNRVWRTKNGTKINRARPKLFRLQPI